MKECSETLVSQTNGNSFVYPGDLALCLVVSDARYKLNDIPIANHTEINERMPVYVAGFPKPPEDHLYCCPQLQNYPPDKIKAEVSNAFDNLRILCILMVLS